MTIFGQLAERERRPVEARKKVRSTRTLSTHVRTVWDQSGLQITANPYVDGSNPSVHLYLIRLAGEDRGFRILKYGFKSRMRYPGM